MGFWKDSFLPSICSHHMGDCHNGSFVNCTAQSFSASVAGMKNSRLQHTTLVAQQMRGGKNRSEKGEETWVFVFVPALATENALCFVSCYIYSHMMFIVYSCVLPFRRICQLFDWSHYQLHGQKKLHRIVRTAWDVSTALSFVWCFMQCTSCFGRLLVSEGSRCASLTCSTWRLTQLSIRVTRPSHGGCWGSTGGTGARGGTKAPEEAIAQSLGGGGSHERRQFGVQADAARWSPWDPHGYGWVARGGSINIHHEKPSRESKRMVVDRYVWPWGMHCKFNTIVEYV